MKPSTPMNRKQLIGKLLDYDTGVYRIMILASFMILFSIGLIGTIGYLIMEKEAVKKLKEKDLIYISESMASKINGRIDRAKETSLSLAYDPVIIDWISGGEKEPELGRYSVQRMVDTAKHFDYSNAFIVSAITGHYWAETGTIIETMSKDDPLHEWFFQALQSKNKVNVTIDYNKGRQETFVFINTLMGDLEDPRAIVGVGLDLKELSEEFQKFKYGKTSNLWLIGPDGSIWLSDDFSHQGKNIEEYISIQETREWIEEADNLNPVVLEYKDHEGHLIDLISYPIANTDWKLLFQIHRDETVFFLNTIKANIAIATFVCLLLIIIIFYLISHYLANPFKRALKLNEELEGKVMERTRELHEKNQALLDSIDYAKRIQESILPSPEKLDEALKEYFLLWKPRDLVGGDFYWIKKLKEDEYVLAVGDCTGHGVPGALMSMMAVSILHQITENEESCDPSSLLQRLNQLVQETLNKEDKVLGTDDGLDISVCYIQGEKLTYAGARCSLFIARNDGEVELIQADKKGIGYRKTDLQYSFTNHEISLEQYPTLYLTTDGFLDQNGGSHNFSFGKKRFIAAIEKYYQQPLADQQQYLSNELEAYMGQEIQRDDILVVGFRPLTRKEGAYSGNSK
ncbi:SpoIIE family protein phosphatase [Ammoniphilus sp. CFH 90114]|uniref:SpoIIE family protein phosphatase n=1 Tax=Ammoniphilus sp. CFH 90114 TaxID=2493665 RepID=UPI00100EDF65|nr:SpoIIE family protein phosphatase [Ammoniphilus sp. CFH 90114]RXT05787.1 stage II sporulation protein E [Ammoniphilus sp. CFH 90114]